MYEQTDSRDGMMEECNNAKGVLLKPVCHWSIFEKRKADKVPRQ